MFYLRYVVYSCAQHPSVLVHLCISSIIAPATLHTPTHPPHLTSHFCLPHMTCWLSKDEALQLSFVCLWFSVALFTFN
eukprot:m.355385 g.355385  ORF g.355385 m.355385 type:complete len:78 (-) comp17240_c0_seq1:26-259(-)